MKIEAMPVLVLRNLEPDALEALVKDAASLAKTAKSQTEAYKDSFAAVGKIYAVLSERLEILWQQKKIGKTTPEKFWHFKTKEKVSSQVVKCAQAFCDLVKTDLVPERDYDKCPSPCLLIVAKISDAVGGDITHEAILKAAGEVIGFGKDSAKNLKAILDGVAEKKTLSPERAEELMTSIIADGHIKMAIAKIGAEIAYLTAANGQEIFLAMDTAMSMFNKNTNIDEKTFNSWIPGAAPENSTSDTSAAPDASSSPAETPAPENTAVQSAIAPAVLSDTEAEQLVEKLGELDTPAAARASRKNRRAEKAAELEAAAA